MDIKFKGDNVCHECPRLRSNSKNEDCSVYTPPGKKFRQDVGHCPVVGRWADWREDKPVITEKKARVGQGKTKQGGNKK